MTLRTGKILSKNLTDQIYHFRTMPGHYGDKKKKTGTKKVSKGLAALAKKRPKVAAAIMKNKRKK